MKRIKGAQGAPSFFLENQKGEMLKRVQHDEIVRIVKVR